MKQSRGIKLVLALSFALLTPSWGCGGGGGDTTAATPDTGKPTAAAHLVSRLREADAALYVYKEFADGANHFTQKDWAGNNYEDIPEMKEDVAGYESLTGIRAKIDFQRHDWGGYMFVNGYLAPGETEPAADFGEHDAGLDLSGASKLVFYAKGEKGGERVEFFLGGLGRNEDGSAVAPYPDSTSKVSLGYVSLTPEWKRYEIPLAGRDLSRIACGFGWTASKVNNPGAETVSFYLDEIHYEWSDGARPPEPLFLQSYAAAPPGTDAANLNNFAYLYDNAAAVIALSRAGERARARQIADAIVYALDHDRHFSDGRLRNAYMGGSPASFPGWFSSKGEPFARLPGFYDAQDGQWYEDYYAVSTSTGNLAWAMLALCEVYEPEHEDYLRAAQEIGNFVLTLRDDDDQGGGFTGGYEGFEGGQTKVTYKSTEHNIDLISAFGKLAKLTGDAQYGEAADHARKFVLSMYDPERGCFYTGTADDDGITVSEDVLPLDSNTWALLALGREFADAAKVLRFIEENMAVGEGYDFNDDRDGVWYEGTAQAALAYKLAGDTAKYEAILAFLNESAQLDGSIDAADRDGVSTGIMVSGTEIPWTYNERVHLGASAWLAFAQMGVNPFEIE